MSNRTVAVICWLLAAGAVLFSTRLSAQAPPPNLPPPGVYRPIPNFSGPGAGMLFRRAINDRFSGAEPIAPMVARLALADFPAAQDGLLLFCTDCKRVDPCTSGGSGAWARGSRGLWFCSSGTLEEDLDAGGKKTTNLGAAAAAGDALSYGQAGARLNGLTGVKADGSDRLVGFSVAGATNVNAFGASSGGSTQSTTGSISASSTTLTLATAEDFADGQGIRISGAGPATSLATPATPAASATCGGTCTTSYAYKVVALDGAGGYTAASTASTAVSNDATLDLTTNFNLIDITPVAGVWAYAVYRNGTLFTVVTNTSSAAGNTSVQVKDYGQSFPSGLPDLPSTAPTMAHNTALDTTIVSGGGTTALVLAAAASATVSGADVQHDDSVVIQAAIDSVPVSGGGTVVFPPGIYTVSTPIQWGIVGGLVYDGLSLIGVNENSTILQPTAALAGLPVIRVMNTHHVKLASLAIRGNSNGPPLAAFESHVNNPVSGPGVGEHLIENINMGSASADSLLNGIVFSASPGWDQNNAENTLENVRSGNIREAAILIGHLNSLQNRIFGGNIRGGTAAIRTFGGSFDMFGSVLAATNAPGNYMFDIRRGDYQHKLMITGVTSEAGGGILRVDGAVAPNNFDTGIRIINSNFKGGPSGGILIDNESSGGAPMGLVIIASHFGEGVSADVVLHGNTEIQNCRLNMNATYFDRLALFGNTWIATPTLTPSGGNAKLFQLNDSRFGQEAASLNNIDIKDPVKFSPTSLSSAITISGDGTDFADRVKIDNGPGTPQFTIRSRAGANGRLQFGGGSPNMYMEFDPAIDATQFPGGLVIGDRFTADNVLPTLKLRFGRAYALNLSAPSSVPGCVDSAPQTVGTYGPTVAPGDVCTGSMDVALQPAQQLSCFVNAAGQVTFRVCQFSGAATDPDGAGASYRAAVEQY